MGNGKEGSCREWKNEGRVMERERCKRGGKGSTKRKRRR